MNFTSLSFQITVSVPLVVFPDSIIAVDGDGIEGVNIDYSLDTNLQCNMMQLKKIYINIKT